MQETYQRIAEAARAIRLDILEMIGGKGGKVGHLGGSSSCAEMVAALYFHKMRHDPKDPGRADRDRLIMSKGHAALAQYAALAELGYFDKDALYAVKSYGAMLQGHPDRNRTPGIEANTGSLGQGLSLGAGMAAGLALDGVDARVYVIMGDGEMAEGQIWEAAMWAAHRGLSRLIGILDCNRVQAMGDVSARMDSGDMAAKWAAFGWRVVEIDGHSVPEVVAALEKADAPGDAPTLILSHTVKGKCVSFAQGNCAFHNGALTPDEYAQARREILAYGREA